MKEDDFMLKKVISTALAFITVASSVVSISSNAYIITEKDSDRYNQIVSQYSDLPTSPEIIDAVNADVFNGEKGCCTKAWRVDNSEDANYSEYWFEYHNNDVVYFVFDNIDISADEINEIIEKLGISESIAYAEMTSPTQEYPDKSYPTIKVYLLSDNNIEICNSITKEVKNKYDNNLRAANGVFDFIEFFHMEFRWDSWSVRDVSTGNFTKLIDSQYEKINDELKENGFDAYFETEPAKIIVSDEYTEVEKFELKKHLHDNYGIDLYQYGECSATDTGAKIDFLADSVAGDANLDGRATVADAVAILQFIGNRDKYELTEQGKFNADVDGVEGVTANDALTIQQWDSQGKL